MIELGAYWAHYSMWLKKMKPRAQVILVEPEAAYLDAGRANFERNGFKGEFIKAFVGTGKFEVDDFFRNRKIKSLDILHTDIQGYETEMLLGAGDVLARRRVRYLFISTHSQAIHTGVVSALQQTGYRVEISSDFDNQTTSFDGFVFASSPDVEPVFGAINVLGRDEIAKSGPAGILKSIADIQSRT